MHHRSEEDFWLAIALEPENLELRRVFGDWLLERGNRWGEFIELELAKSPSAELAARKAELLSTFGTSWLPRGVRDCIDRGAVTWRHGFPASLRITSQAGAEAVRLHPVWTLVQELWAPPVALLSHCEQLRALYDVEPRDLHGLPVQRQAQLEALGLVVGSGPVDLAPFRLTSLRHLTLSPQWGAQNPRDAAGWYDDPPLFNEPWQLRPSALRWLWSSPWWRQLRLLSLEVGWVSPEFFTELATVELHLDALRLLPTRQGTRASWALALSATRPGRYTTLEVSLGDDPRDAQDVASVLSALPADAFEVLVLPRTAPKRLAGLRCFQAAELRRT